MNYGVFSTADSYPDSRTKRGSGRASELLDLAALAERLGFASFWVTEHHFQLGGTIPAPPVWLAAAAQRTRTIRLGALVAVLPLHDPRDLAEQYALADELSGGRIEIGVGAGYVAEEFDGFGRSVGDRHRLLEAALPEFLTALRGEPLAIRACGSGSVRLNVAPLQVPHPPIWHAAGRPASVTRVGRAGGALALIPYASLSSLEDLAPQVRAYHAQLPRGAQGKVLAAFHVYVGSRAEVAERALQRFLDTRPRVGAGPEGSGSPKSPNLSARELRQAGLALIGSRSEVSDRLETIQASGITDLLAIVDFGQLPASEIRTSLGRWARMTGVSRKSSPTAIPAVAPTTLEPLSLFAR